MCCPDADLRGRRKKAARRLLGGLEQERGGSTLQQQGGRTQRVRMMDVAEGTPVTPGTVVSAPVVLTIR